MPTFGVSGREEARDWSGQFGEMWAVIEQLQAQIRSVEERAQRAEAVARDHMPHTKPADTSASPEVKDLLGLLRKALMGRGGEGRGLKVNTPDAYNGTSYKGAISFMQ